MGWGKSVLRWSAGPEQALANLLDLNDRFALDGHSPPSVGGLLSPGRHCQ
jgi:deoxyribodipyrimidine photo-lyase